MEIRFFVLSVEVSGNFKRGLTMAYKAKIS